MAKKITVLFCLLVLLVAIPFLWKENYDLSKGINYEKINAYFSSIGSIATALVIFLMYKQIQLQNDQLIADFEPNIHMANMDLICSFSYSRSTITSNLINNEITLRHSSTGVETQKITIENNGNNDAFDVKLKWKKIFITGLGLKYLFSKASSQVYYLKDLYKGSENTITIPTFFAGLIVIAKNQFDNNERLYSIICDEYLLKIEYRDRRKIKHPKNIPVHFIFRRLQNDEVGVKIEFDN